MPIKGKFKKSSRKKRQKSNNQHQGYDFHLTEKNQTQQAKEQLEKESFNYIYDQVIEEKNEPLKQEEGWKNQKNFLVRNMLNQRFKSQAKQDLSKKNKTSFTQQSEQNHYLIPKSSANHLLGKKKSADYQCSEKKKMNTSCFQIKNQKKLTKIKLYPKEYTLPNPSVSNRRKTYSSFQPSESKKIQPQILNFVNIGRKKQKKIISQLQIKRQDYQPGMTLRKKLYSTFDKNYHAIFKHKGEQKKRVRISLEKGEVLEKNKEEARQEFEKLKKLINYEKRKEGGLALSPLRIVQL